LKVLVYTRPRTSAFFQSLCESTKIFTDVKYFSDAPRAPKDHIQLMQRYYHFKRRIVDGHHVDWSLWDSLDFADIHSRCRYLRQLSPAEAGLRIKAMSSTIHALISEYDPDYILGLVMDSYPQDIAHRLMKQRGGAYIGLLNNMLNGYSRITTYGELLTQREVSQDEIDRALQQLSDAAYVPSMQRDFMWSTHPARMFFTKYLKEKAKSVYYWTWRNIMRDPDNFYANTVGHESCMSCHKIDQLFYRRFEDKDYQVQIATAKASGKTIVYLPLQFYPECSLDYWIAAPQMRNFYDVMDRICALKPDDYLIVVKEHPSASGLRKSRFYRKLKKAPHILIAPFDELSNNVIEQADVVLTWTGSVGIEAAVREKPLISFGGVYFDPGKRFPTLETFDDVMNLGKFVKRARNVQAEIDLSALKRDVIAYLLSGLVKGYIFVLDYGSSKNPVAQDRMSILALSLSNSLTEFTCEAKQVR